MSEEKQRLADKLNRLKSQQQQPPPQLQMETSTPEQTAARDFVHQWSNRPQQRLPPQARQNLDNTQSTMTGLANQFQQMAVDPVQQVLQQLGAQAQLNKVQQATPQLHLVPAEEQHVKVMEDEKDN